MKALRWLLGLLMCVGAAAQAADIDALVKQLKDKDNDVRRQAVKELAEAGKDAQTATPYLVASLKDNDLFVRRFAAQALGEIEADPKLAVPALAAMLQNPKERKEAQQAAAASLGKMGAAGTTPLATAIKDGSTDNDVRRKAIESVGNIGPVAKAAIPALVSQLKMMGGGKKNPNNKDADFRIEAATSLGKIATAKDKEALGALRDLAGGKDLKKNKNLGDALRKAIQEIELRKES
jgi:HEAT repeat protein